MLVVDIVDVEIRSDGDCRTGTNLLIICSVTVSLVGEIIVVSALYCMFWMVCEDSNSESLERLHVDSLEFGCRNGAVLVGVRELR